MPAHQAAQVVALQAQAGHHGQAGLQLTNRPGLPQLPHQLLHLVGQHQLHQRRQAAPKLGHYLHNLGQLVGLQPGGGDLQVLQQLLQLLLLPDQAVVLPVLPLLLTGLVSPNSGQLQELPAVGQSPGGQVGLEQSVYMWA